MNKPKLFLMHYAGGNVYSYNFLSSLIKKFNVIPLELPGRGRRKNEDLLQDFDQASTDLFNQISSTLEASDAFAVYGHSMGAYLALTVSKMLQDSGTPPRYLFVSGNPGPGIHRNKELSLLEREEFVKELSALGGIPEEILESQEMLDYFLPIIRADFNLVYMSKIDDNTIVHSPIFAMMGSNEENAHLVENWRKFSDFEFNYKIFNGGHFFVHESAEEIANIIDEKYDEIFSSNRIYNKTII